MKNTLIKLSIIVLATFALIMTSNKSNTDSVSADSVSLEQTIENNITIENNSTSRIEVVRTISRLSLAEKVNLRDNLSSKSELTNEEMTIYNITRTSIIQTFALRFFSKAMLIGFISVVLISSFSKLKTKNKLTNAFESFTIITFTLSAGVVVMSFVSILGLIFYQIAVQ